MTGAVLVAFLMLLMGLEILILELAYSIRDEDRANRTEAFTGASRESMPTAWILNRTSHPPKEFHAEAVDEAILVRVQKYLEAEQTLAAEFVSKPSVEALYRESGRKVLLG